MLFSTLTADNFEMYAAKAYKNLQCVSTNEFKSDLTTIKYIKISLAAKKPNYRLILNQFILFFNVFEIEAAVRLILFRCDPKHYPAIKSILLFLNYLPDYMHDIDEVDMDVDLYNELEKL